MKKYYLVTFLFALILYVPVAIAQVPGKPTVLGFEAYRNQAKVFFDRGDYVRANNLYKVCKDLPGVSPEVQTAILFEIRRTVDIQRLMQEADYKLRQGDREGVKMVYDKILSERFNPNDRRVKEEREKLKGMSAQSPDSEKWEKQADKFLAQDPPNYQRANEVLRVIPARDQSPIVKAKLKLTRDLPYRISIINDKRSGGLSTQKEIEELANKYPESPSVKILITGLNDEKEYWRKRRTAERYVATCRFEQAKIIYRALRQSYPQFARTTTTRINKLQHTTQLINEVNALRPDTDPYKQAKILYIYSVLYRSSRNCIEDDYFEYVYARGVKQMQNNKLPEAIINFERAFSVSRALANRNRVPTLADSCRRLLACQKQFQVYKSMLADAELLYRRCLSDSAINLYKKAQVYSCQKADSKSEEIWQGRLTSVTQNRQQQGNFMKLVDAANNLLEESRCEEALLLYRQADSTQVDCQQLDKSILRIAECENCIKQQCFDTLMVKADRSREANYRRDQLRYYRAALICPAPLSRVADLQKSINELECLIENKNCPPPPPVPFIKSFIKPSIIIGGNRTTPELYKQGKSEAISAATGYIVGIRIERISSVKPVDYRVEMRFAGYSFNSLIDNNLVKQSFKINTVEASGGFKVHTLPQNKGGIRLYTHGNIGYNKPVAYKNENYLSSTKYSDVEDLSNGFVSARGGIGFEIQRSKWGFNLETYYGLLKKDLFNNVPSKQSFQNQDNFFAPNATHLGIEIGVRFW